MITSTGKDIIGKYLIGQAPSYASYIAVGCGPKPLATAEAYGDYSLKTSLDFEMFRVPISSRGYVNDNGTNKIVFTAELPTEERYEITEVGIYSAGSNPSASENNSKTVFSFAESENWQYHTTSVAEIPSLKNEALDFPSLNNIIATTEPVFETNADNLIFFNADRVERYERSRYLNNTILLRGDTSDLTELASPGANNEMFGIESGSNHIHLTGISVDLSKNSPNDEIRLAFSIVNKSGATFPSTAPSPEEVRIIVEFASAEESGSSFARFEASLVDGVDGVDFDANRYFVISKKLSELAATSDFTWNSVTLAKIYTCILFSSAPSNAFYLSLDALRVENVSTVNPLYGLTGYSVIKNSDAETIIKQSNASNYIEFRFAVGVT